jgi:hypothetical protein
MNSQILDVYIPEKAAMVRINAARMPSSHFTWVCKHSKHRQNSRWKGRSTFAASSRY